MDEQSEIEAKGDSVEALPVIPLLENAPPPRSSPTSATVRADSAARAIGRDIRLQRRALKKFEKAEREALRDIAKRGAAVVEVRCDNAGNPHDKRVPNPSIRIARECRTAAAALRKEIARLEAAAAASAPKEMSKLENLVARAGSLRK